MMFVAVLSTSFCLFEAGLGWPFFITSKTSTSFCFQSNVFFPINALNIIEYAKISFLYLSKSNFLTNETLSPSTLEVSRLFA